MIDRSNVNSLENMAGKKSKVPFFAPALCFLGLFEHGGCESPEKLENCVPKQIFPEMN